MDAALRVAHARQSVDYLNVASLVIFIFDYFQTLDLEIDYVWKSKGFTGKALFFLNRYPPFVDVPLTVYYYLNGGVSSRTCSILDSVTIWMTSFGIAMSEVILLLRTYALWGRNRIILVILTTLLVGIYITVIVILTIFIRSVKYGNPPLPIISGCYDVEGSDILFVVFVLLLLNETIVFTLTMWVGVKRYRHAHNPLVVVLYRDGILFFGLIFAISCSYILVLTVGPEEFYDILNTFQRVMHSILASHIILHVRETAATGTDDSVEMSTSLTIRVSEYT
ncbi:hypothetical protein BDZ94DRAFT_1253950 [Collybia nuda]|uniref:DUF6533 domain-containing protein n=1 Tax=Collybia nuda TaxID=64659 RepID=A0A9P5YCS7_9AGAR|nr:hypothetical protein BDZ94DRAFT_1253950 [Collybia nuda]